MNDSSSEPPSTRPVLPPVEVLSRVRLHQGRIFEVVAESIRLPSGRRQDLEIVRHPGAVAIAAHDEAGRLVLVRQYRILVDCGMFQGSRELEEETGLRAARWEPLLVLAPAPGFCSERVHLFRAEGLREVPGGGLPADADEQITVERRTPAELLAAGLEDAKTLVAALLAAR